VAHHRLRLLALCSLAFAGAAFALDPSRAITQYVHRVWTVQNGLTQNSVQSMAQTPDGYLWLGTEVGVVRFDGLRFTPFDPSNAPKLRSANITALFVDRGGRLWVGGGRGLNVHRDGAFHEVPGTAGVTSVFGIAEVPESGTMWFGSSHRGLYAYKDGVARRDPAVPAQVYAMSACRGTLWAGTAEGLYRHDRGSTKRIDGIDGPIYALACAERGVWVAGAGLLHYDGSRVTRPVARLEKEEVWAVLADRRGSLWIGTRSGLWRWAGGVLSRMGIEHGLSSNYVQSVFEDAEGTLWAGTNLGGVNQFRDGLFLPYTHREGLVDTAVWSVVQERSGAMLAATERGGVNRFAGGRWSRVPGGPIDDAMLTAVWPDADGSVWVGSDGNGLHHLRSDGTVRVYTTRDGLPANEIFALLRARDGALWIGSSAGPVRFAGGRFRVFDTKDGLGGAFVIALYEDRRGRVWVSTGDAGGPAWFDGTRFHLVKLGNQDSPNVAVCVYEDGRGDYWFGSRAGLHRLHDGRIFTYTGAHGLVPGMITYVFEDAAGALWLSGQTGLFRVPRKALDDIMAGRASKIVPVVYGMGDGLPGPGVVASVSPSAWRATDGTLWMATGRGIAVLDPRARFPALRARPLVEEVRLDDAVAATKGVVRMRPDVDRIRFHYTAPSTTVADRIRFRYKLAGYDARWIDAGERRVAEYTNLPPGRYRFLVEASHGGETWLSATRPVAVHRLPAIHQTPWFLLACAIAVTAMIWVVHARRMRTLRLRHEAVHNERHRIALEFHDTLATGLTGAMMHIQGAIDRAEDPAGAAEHLHTGKGLLRATMDDARRALFNLRAARLEARGLADALTAMVTTTTNGLPVKGIVEVRGTPRPLADHTREHHLLRIAQEALTNALRHSGARTITVVLEYRRGTIVLTVRDDGRGSGEFPPGSSPETSYGLRGMRERADAIGAKLTVSTRPRGFEVAVELKG